MHRMMLLPFAALIVTATPGSSNPPSIARQIAPADEQQQGNPSAGGGAAPGAVSLQDKKICRQLPSSYSRLRNRACLTAKEWRMVEDDLSH
ncbi:MAG TPA: hypothetical protein VE968_02985 [Sphingomicrobium sp.]|nr:hypothetical protein [Sphingomicrobium sp.]